MKQDKAGGCALAMCALLALATLTLGSAALRPMQPLLREMGRQATFWAVATTLPEGTLEVLRARLAGAVQDTDSLPAGAPVDDLPGPRDEEGLPGWGLAEREPPKEPSAAAKPVRPPQVEARYRGTLLEEQMRGSESAVCLKLGNAYLRNYTDMDSAQIRSALQKPVTLRPAADGRVEVLILHTHATESYEAYDAGYYDTRNDWRTTDNNRNMVAVGEVLAAQLEAAGIGVVHDATQHDYPSYNGAYERSAATARRYLKEYPDIKYIIDVHRDGIQRDSSTIVKPTVTIGGRKAAQLMLLAGSGKQVPGWQENLRLTCAVTEAIETRYPGLTRPVYLSGGRYNMHLSGGVMLFEVGSQANTLEEALYTAELAGEALGGYLRAQAQTK